MYAKSRVWQVEHMNVVHIPRLMCKHGVGVFPLCMD